MHQVDHSKPGADMKTAPDTFKQLLSSSSRCSALAWTRSRGLQRDEHQYCRVLPWLFPPSSFLAGWWKAQRGNRAARVGHKWKLCEEICWQICVAQKQGPCYFLKMCMHQLKLRISVFAGSSTRNQKSGVCNGAEYLRLIEMWIWTTLKIQSHYCPELQMLLLQLWI